MITTLTADVARRWLTEGVRQLAAVRTRVDALNVFPVPDADTGTNVVLTVSAGIRRAQQLPADASLPALTAAVADGALWGARGNSGIIISQAFQAVARTFAQVQEAGPTHLIQALDAIALAAHDAVAEPVEGTIITVSRAVADAVVQLPVHTCLADVAATAHRAGIASLLETGEQLREATGAQVTFDAGAASFVILLDALAHALGVEERPAIPWESATNTPAGDSCPELGGGEFEVMYVVQTDRRHAHQLRSHLRSVGQSVAVVAGQDQHWHVHVHLDDPAQALPDIPAQQVAVRNLHTPADHPRVVATCTAPGLLEHLARCGAVALLHPTRDALIQTLMDAPAATILPASETIAAMAREAADDPLIKAEGITVQVADTDCDPHVFAACAEWGITQLVDEHAHPHLIANGIAAQARVIDITASSAHQVESLAATALRSLHPAGESVTVFVGDTPLAPALATAIHQALPDSDVTELPSAQRSPDVWLLYREPDE